MVMEFYTNTQVPSPSWHFGMSLWTVTSMWYWHASIFALCVLGFVWVSLWVFAPASQLFFSFLVCNASGPQFHELLVRKAFAQNLRTVYASMVKLKFFSYGKN